MAVETKPLFHPDIVRQHAGTFALPASAEAALNARIFALFALIP